MKEASTDFSNALCLTQSNSSSLRSYTSSLAESTGTTKSAKSLSSKFNKVLGRKRSQSLMSLPQATTTSQSQKDVIRLIRNKSISSLVPPTLLSGSQSSSRDSSIASLSDMEVEQPISPLFKIEEDSVEMTGRFSKFPHEIQTVKYTCRKDKMAPVSPTKIVDHKEFDEIADDILTKVNQETSIEWRI